MGFFPQLKLINYLWKLHSYPQFSFEIPKVFVKYYFLRIVLEWFYLTHEIGSRILRAIMH